MNHLLFIQVIVSFVVGGLFIALLTIVAEKVPPFWRGMVLTVPSTMALGLLFVGITKTVGDVRAAAIVAPAAIGATYFFVTLFALLHKLSLPVRFAIAMAGWFVYAFLLSRIPPHTFVVSFVLYGVVVVLLLYWWLDSQHAEQVHFTAIRITRRQMLSRVVLSGSVIVAVVLASKLISNEWGGILSGFPAGICATLFIYQYTYGKKVIPAVARSLFFPGAIGYMVYAVIAGLSFPHYGIWLGTLVSYAGTAVFYLAWNVRHLKRETRR